MTVSGERKLQFDLCIIDLAIGAAEQREILGRHCNLQSRNGGGSGMTRTF
jgi:hypothetical protein